MKNDSVKDITSKVLAANVIIYRYLGINKEQAIKCMEELLARREAGDSFNFEEYIDTELKNLPPTTLDKNQKSIFEKISKTNLKNL